MIHAAATGPQCGRCGQPIHDTAYICSDCVRDHRGTGLAGDLQVVVLIAGEAATTVGKLDRMADTAGTTQADDDLDTEWTTADSALYPTPLPVDLAAARRHDDAVRTLQRWVRHIHHQSGRPLPTVRRFPCTHPSCDARWHGLIAGPRCPGGEPMENPTAAAARWLMDQLDWLRHRPEAADAFDSLHQACRAIEHIVDRPPDRWFAGLCSCGEPLTPTAGAKTFTCGSCGTIHDLVDRKDQLLDQAEDVLGGATWCAHTLTRHGVRVSPAAVWKWAERERILSHGHDNMGHPLYRLGDVRALAEDTIRRDLLRRHQAEEKARKKARKKAEKEAADEAERRADADLLDARSHGLSG